MDSKRFGVGTRVSEVIDYGDLLFQAGQVADDTSHDVEGQTRQVLAKIGSVLKEAVSDKTKILKVNIWLADIGDFDTMITYWRRGSRRITFRLEPGLIRGWRRRTFASRRRSSPFGNANRLHHPSRRDRCPTFRKRADCR